MIILSHTTQLISQYSKYAISWEMQEVHFEHQQGHETFLLSTTSRQVRGPTHCVLGVLFPGVRQQWSKANHPLQLVPRLKYMALHIHSPISFHDMQRENFIIQHKWQTQWFYHCRHNIYFPYSYLCQITGSSILQILKYTT